jgi:hypothetical protein
MDGEICKIWNFEINWEGKFGVSNVKKRGHSVMNGINHYK